MKIDISDILVSDGADMKVDLTGVPLQQEPADGYIIEGDMSFCGTLTNNNGILHLAGWLEAVYKSACYRCLGEVSSRLRLKISENFTSNSDADKKDMYPFEGKMLDISRALNDNIILNLPMKHLCSDQCRGLCSKCGGNLNEVQCDCIDDGIDPRMEGLNKFFERS
ncbi:MAG: DUF177 domain-containing protein [Acetivibrionales bacterium]|jgi:uncharacterized protein|nr:DUF177 domain-containing protein [Bacillota bacterium]NLP07619.1 DUF177 domain-containing protein [Clostridiaceae bacterium]HOA54241.1 DUF177 domain-containing protein [Clostridiales bacterium]HPZ06019.1 DUF177 domain-containing protein [Clostridiales bacterium]HQD30588.1 DUF177 domain-containing protein [Clostridiales bacterium]